MLHMTCNISLVILSLCFNAHTIFMAAKQSFRPFTLAFIQLGQVGPNKADNIKHARDMILKAASGQSHNKKPDLVVLPVRS